jgi:hypothetical protein
MRKYEKGNEKKVTGKKEYEENRYERNEGTRDGSAEDKHCRSAGGCKTHGYD